MAAPDREGQGVRARGVVAAALAPGRRRRPAPACGSTGDVTPPLMAAGGGGGLASGARGGPRRGQWEGGMPHVWGMEIDVSRGAEGEYIVTLDSSPTLAYEATRSVFYLLYCYLLGTYSHFFGPWMRDIEERDPAYLSCISYSSAFSLSWANGN